jgi:hypothetical protein
LNTKPYILAYFINQVLKEPPSQIVGSKVEFGIATSFCGTQHQSSSIHLNRDGSSRGGFGLCPAASGGWRLVLSEDHDFADILQIRSSPPNITPTADDIDEKAISPLQVSISHQSFLCIILELSVGVVSVFENLLND